MAHLFIAPRTGLLRQQGCRARVVGAQTARGLAEDVVREAQVLHTVAQGQHGGAAVGARRARVTRVQAHDVQHVPEVEANGPDAQQGHAGRRRGRAGGLRHAAQAREGAPRGHVEPQGARVRHHRAG